MSEKVKMELSDEELGSVAGGMVVSQVGKYSLGEQWMDENGGLALNRDYDRMPDHQKAWYKRVDVSDKPFIVLDPQGIARGVFDTKEEADEFIQKKGYYWYGPQADK